MPTSRAEPAPKRGGHVVRQRVVGATPGGRRRLPRPRALPAPGLPQCPDQHRRAARRTPVEVGDPVVGALAVGAHEHLLVIDDATLPGAGTLARIRLPGAAVVTGHHNST